MSYAPSEALLRWAELWAKSGGARGASAEAKAERRAWRAFWEEMREARPTAAYKELPEEARAAYHFSRVSFDIAERIRRETGALANSELIRESARLDEARAGEAREKAALHGWITGRLADEEHLAMAAAAM